MQESKICVWGEKYEEWEHIFVEGKESIFS